MRLRSVFYSVLFLFFSIIVAAQTPEKYNLSVDSTVNRLAGIKRVYVATRINNRPKIDGKLNDACWEAGIWAGGFTQQVPNQGSCPRKILK